MFNSFEYWKEIAKDIKVPTDFAWFEDDCCEDSTSDEIFCEDICETIDGFYASGCTKCVFVNKDKDAVLKIPFFGYSTEEPAYDEDTKTYDWSNCSYEFNPYSNADVTDSTTGELLHANNDYCALEIKIYNLVKEYGFEEFLAETKFLSMDNDNKHPLYIQERCRFSVESTSSEEVIAMAKTVATNKKCYLETHWVADAITFYGLEKVEKFIDFINSTNLLTDLHCGNIGYRLNGAPVIVDYAGFHH